MQPTNVRQPKACNPSSLLVLLAGVLLVNHANGENLHLGYPYPAKVQRHVAKLAIGEDARTVPHNLNLELLIRNKREEGDVLQKAQSTCRKQEEFCREMCILNELGIVSGTGASKKYDENAYSKVVQKYVPSKTEQDALAKGMKECAPKISTEDSATSGCNVDREYVDCMKKSAAKEGWLLICE